MNTCSFCGMDDHRIEVLNDECNEQAILQTTKRRIDTQNAYFEYFVTCEE